MKEKKNNISTRLFVATFALIVSLIVLSQCANIKADCVILNEVCCYNDTIIHDTIGTYRDYIELYNPTESDKDIGGFYLSDDKHNLKKYIIPENVVLKSGEYAFFWAGTWTTDVLIEDASFYTGFSLREGEIIYLSDADGNVLDRVKIPNEMETDIAYSRIDSLNYMWEMTQASPGWKNYESLKAEEPCLDEEVVFSVKSGFYSEPFYLEMTTDGGNDIYYTLDGSAPTAESHKYEGSILIKDVSDNENKYSNIENISLMDDIYVPSYNVEKATVIRAVAIDENGLESRESYATYFVDYGEKQGFENISTISLITDPENLFGYEQGIYVTGALWDLNKEKAYETLEYWQYVSPVNYLEKGRGWRREATIQYFDEAGTLMYEQQVALGNHGNRSQSYNQKSFNLYAIPEVDGNEYVFDGLFEKSERSLVLRNGGGDCYGTKLRDVLTQSLVSDCSLLVAEFQPCQVFIDGEYWGLYMLQERICESMVTGQYAVEEDNLVILKTDEVVAGEESDFTLWEEVVRFANTSDLSVEENYRQIESMIDIQSCIDYYSFLVYVAHSDSLYNNHARWRVRETGMGEYEDGKWRWILYDIDSSTGKKQGMSSVEVDTFISGNYWHSVLEDELFSALMKNEEFKQRFVISFMDMANDNFNADKVVAKIDELADELCEATVASQKRFLYEGYSSDDYIKEINILKDFFENRYANIIYYLKKDLALEGKLVPITVKNSIGGNVILNNVNVDEEETFNGYYYSDYCVEVLAESRDGYVFSGWVINGEIDSEEQLVLPLDEGLVIMPLWEEET